MAGVDREVASLEGTAALPRRNGELVFEAPWQGRAFGMAVVLRQYFSPMEMHDRASRWRSWFSAVDGIVNRQKMRGWKSASPLHIQRRAPPHFDSGARGRGAITPQRRGWKVAVQLLLELEHRDLQDLSRRGADHRRE